MTTPEPDRPYADLVTVVADAVRAVPEVDDLHGGSLGEVATLLPGDRVPGLRLRDDAWEVHVTLTWGAHVATAAAAVRAALAELAGDKPVHVVVEDFGTPAVVRPVHAPPARPF
ncbi:hypothetical protein [Nocardioides alkalitolerans]|uniref:hypothetical protein n=1 Tax=Nocardioides alkalitolerans TaxID=281714 RepID=UPI00040CF02E|nr:hypothetical protein [Nocardioides alkalitolerans]